MLFYFLYMINNYVLFSISVDTLCIKIYYRGYVIDMSHSFFSSDNEAFSGLVYYGTLIVLKVLLMAPLTSLFRIAKNSFATPEDSIFAIFNNGRKSPKKLVEPDADVERVCNVHCLTIYDQYSNLDDFSYKTLYFDQVSEHFSSYLLFCLAL